MNDKINPPMPFPYVERPEWMDCHAAVRLEPQPFIPQDKFNSAGWSADFRTWDERYPTRKEYQ